MLCKDKGSLWQRSRHIILYVAFGVLTLLVNLCTYWLCFGQLGLSNVLSSIIAWSVAILTAFVTNKLWVFESRGLGWRGTLRELGKFFYCRLATGAFDLTVMYVGVDILEGPPVALKALADFVSAIINYAASRWLVFHYQSKAARLRQRPLDKFYS